jgi:bifunctional enzyme CysN/CysC
MDVLRVSTAGSVDDGKSTLLGRLLHDVRAACDDQLAAVAAQSARRGAATADLSLLVDGLRAERERGITIDVAHRYFATAARKFVLIDTPGHAEYTRNMVTGASSADVALVLVDAERGVRTQSRRHVYLAGLLGVRHLVVAVNKMDRVGWSQPAFDALAGEMAAFAAGLGFASVVAIPVSALHGDFVATRGDLAPWYDGPTLLEHLERLPPAVAEGALRFPVQLVLRAADGERHYAGRVARGSVRPGDEWVVMPAGRRTVVRAVGAPDGARAIAGAGDSVALVVSDDVDIGRGSLLVSAAARPRVDSALEAVACWLGDAELQPGRDYWLRHGPRELRARVTRVLHTVDVDTRATRPATTLACNDIGRVHVTTSEPLCYDAYTDSRATGAAILIDPDTDATVAAVMLVGPATPPPPPPALPVRKVSPDVQWQPWNITAAQRQSRNGHRAGVVWFTGLSGAGKSTIATALERRLFAAGCQTMLLDGDQLRHGLNGDLGFTAADRAENVRRAGEVAALFCRQGCVVLCTFVSPFAADRAAVRALVPADAFVEVFVATSLRECERRDPKGLYRRARAGELAELTGVSSPYEAPVAPELRLDTADLDVDTAVERVAAELACRGMLRSG